MEYETVDEPRLETLTSPCYHAQLLTQLARPEPRADYENTFVAESESTFVAGPDTVPTITSDIEVDLDTLVLAFNSLPRPPLAFMSRAGPPAENVWHFSIRTVDMEFERHDILLIVSPPNNLVHIAGPTEMNSLDLTARAEVVVELLLETFVYGVCSFLQEGPSNAVRIVPWTWCCNCPGLSEAVQDSQQILGVRRDLRFVQSGLQEHNRWSDMIWAEHKNDFARLAAEVWSMEA